MNKLFQVTYFGRLQLLSVLKHTINAAIYVSYLFVVMGVHV